jgi:hypothetical protein
VATGLGRGGGGVFFTSGTFVGTGFGVLIGFFSAGVARGVGTEVFRGAGVGEAFFSGGDDALAPSPFASDFCDGKRIWIGSVVNITLRGLQ